VYLNFDLGRQFGLETLHMWNHNQVDGGVDLTSRGINQFDVLVSNNADAFGNPGHQSWNEVRTDLSMDEAPTGSDNIAPVSAQDFDLSSTSGQFLGIRIDTNHGNDFTGLSEMRVSVPNQPHLQLDVDTGTGQVTLKNPTSTGSVSTDNYRITSESGSLQPENWNSLQAQDYEGSGPPGGGDGWEEGGKSDSSELIEFYLKGQSEIGPGESINLGNIFAPSGEQDLSLEYFDDDFESMRTHPVEYIQSLLFGDANNDGVVDASDLTAIKNNFGGSGTDDGTLIGDANDDGVIDASDLTAIKNNFGESLAGGATANAVPSPASVALLGLGGMMLLPRRRPRRHRQGRA